ncbi:MAG: Thiamine pyrophosphate-requiring enzyme [Micavibrio sp.]|nr:Thiamine pyrophosphate-requiring enzyme [Micavibrio sp.]
MQMFKGTGGQILVETLYAHGVERISSVAGESYLPVLDALLDRPQIEVITCRQEGGAGFMAEAWGKLTGRPGVCFVTRGPGVCNASIAIHTAKQDSTPMIVFMGQVRRWERGREAFQEVDVRAVFGTLAKWATEIDDPSRIPEIVGHAFNVSTSGRPGPVVIGLPEDMLSEMSEAFITPPMLMPKPVARNEDIDGVITLLQKARQPIALIGGSGWSEEGIAELASFCRASHIPLVAAFRNHDLIDHKHGCYIGELGTGPNPALVRRVSDADVLLVIGSRLDEITTQNYTLLERQTLVQIHQDGLEMGKVYRPTLAIQSDLNEAAKSLAAMAFKLDGRVWAGWRDDARKDYQDWTAIDLSNRPAFAGADMTVIFDTLRNILPPDAIVTTDAGNFSGWAQRYLQYGRPGRLLAPVSGAMGYSVPSAIGASIANPGRVVLGLCGDGGFMMNGQELATAMHHGATPIIMICNNGIYGTIRMHQEKKYPGRVSATSLTNPDFVALAKSYGAFSATVENAADFPAVWDAARNAGRVAVIEVRMDVRQLTTNSKL